MKRKHNPEKPAEEPKQKKIKLATSNEPLPSETSPEMKFSELKINNIVKAHLLKDYTALTPIQQKVIPYAISHQNEDIVGYAKTGSGKTLAFLIPVFHYLMESGILEQMETVFEANRTQHKRATVNCLIIAHSNILVTQIFQVIQTVMNYKKLKVNCLVSKESFNKQKQELLKGSHIVCSTLGRLKEHLSQNYFDFTHLKYLIIDEADQFAEAEEEDLKDLINVLPSTKLRTTYLFSATKASNFAYFTDFLKPTFQTFGVEESNASNVDITFQYAIIPENRKYATLIHLMLEHSDQKVMIFFSTKAGLNYFRKIVDTAKVNYLFLQGGMSKEEREANMKEFASIKKGFLLCSDVVGRGMDFANVDLVICYDIINPKLMIHRSGRTGRAGKQGTCLMLFTATQAKEGCVEQIQQGAAIQSMEQVQIDEEESIEDCHEIVKQVFGKLTEGRKLLGHIYVTYLQMHEHNPFMGSIEKSLFFQNMGCMLLNNTAPKLKHKGQNRR